MSETSTASGQHHQSAQQEQSQNDAWGDNINSNNKTSNKIRIAFQNINGYITNNDDVKTQSIKDFIEDKYVDIMGMAETNVNWNRLPKHKTIQSTIRGWSEHQHLTTAFNQRDNNKSRHQPGGTAIYCRDELGLRFISAGVDDKKIGRWSWMKFRGKDKKIMTFISVYVPSIASGPGSKKVYNQQKKALLSMGIVRSVMSTFWTDLWELVDECLDNGEAVTFHQCFATATSFRGGGERPSVPKRLC